MRIALVILIGVLMSFINLSAADNAAVILHEFLKAHEGFRGEVYLPTKNDKPTIGYGFTDKKYVSLGSMTEEQASTILMTHVIRELNWLNARLPVFKTMSEHQKAALGSLVFNIGRANFLNSTAYKQLKDGRIDGIPAQMMRWIYQKKIKLPGLVNRRKAEVKLWFSKDVTV